MYDEARTLGEGGLGGGAGPVFLAGRAGSAESFEAAAGPGFLSAPLGASFDATFSGVGAEPTGAPLARETGGAVYIAETLDGGPSTAVSPDASVRVSTGPTPANGHGSGYQVAPGIPQSFAVAMPVAAQDAGERHMYKWEEFAPFYNPYSVYAPWSSADEARYHELDAQLRVLEAAQERAKVALAELYNTVEWLEEAGFDAALIAAIQADLTALSDRLRAIGLAIITAKEEMEDLSVRRWLNRAKQV